MNGINLNEVRIKLPIKEFEEKVKTYYLNMDETVKKVKATYGEKRSGGVYDAGWGRTIGSTYSSIVNIQMTREEYVLGKTRTITDNFTIGEKELVNIFNELLEDENLEVKSVYQFLDPEITISCHRIEKKEKIDYNKDETANKSAVNEKNQNKKEINNIPDLLDKATVEDAIAYLTFIKSAITSKASKKLSNIIKR